MKKTQPAFVTDDHGQRRKRGSVDGCGTGALTLAITVLALLALLLPGAVQAQSEWDGSSIALTGRCLPDGTAEFTVINNGRDMAGPAPWREYEADIETTVGTFQLASAQTQVWTFVSNGVPVRFEVEQRPGHPGNSAPKLTLTCERTTAVSAARVQSYQRPATRRRLSEGRRGGLQKRSRRPCGLRSARGLCLRRLLFHHAALPADAARQGLRRHRQVRGRCKDGRCKTQALTDNLRRGEY